jgi:hypothetical protein
MLRKSAYLLAFGASLIAVTPADACCGCATACASRPIFHAYPGPIHRAYREPIYVVNQGPIYSGPGIMTVPGYLGQELTPAVYPYVGRHSYRYSYRWRHGLLYPPARKWHGTHIGPVYR